MTWVNKKSYTIGRLGTGTEEEGIWEKVGCFTKEEDMMKAIGVYDFLTTKGLCHVPVQIGTRKTAARLNLTDKEKSILKAFSDVILYIDELALPLNAGVVVEDDHRKTIAIWYRLLGDNQENLANKPYVEFCVGSYALRVYI